MSKHTPTTKNGKRNLAGIWKKKKKGLFPREEGGGLAQKVITGKRGNMLYSFTYGRGKKGGRGKSVCRLRKGRKTGHKKRGFHRQEKKGRRVGSPFRGRKKEWKGVLKREQYLFSTSRGRGRSGGERRIALHGRKERRYLRRERIRGGEEKNSTPVGGEKIMYVRRKKKKWETLCASKRKKTEIFAMRGEKLWKKGG